MGKFFINIIILMNATRKKNEMFGELKDQCKKNASYTNHGVVAHEGDPSGKSKAISYF